MTRRMVTVSTGLCLIAASGALILFPRTAGARGSQVVAHRTVTGAALARTAHIASTLSTAGGLLSVASQTSASIRAARQGIRTSGSGAARYSSGTALSGGYRTSYLRSGLSRDAEFSGSRLAYSGRSHSAAGSMANGCPHMTTGTTRTGK